MSTTDERKARAAAVAAALSDNPEERFTRAVEAGEWEQVIEAFDEMWYGAGGSGRANELFRSEVRGKERGDKSYSRWYDKNVDVHHAIERKWAEGRRQ